MNQSKQIIEQMSEKELNLISGGPRIRNFGTTRRFVTYTEVEIHKPSVAGSETHFSGHPVNSDNQNKRPIWKRER